MPELPEVETIARGLRPALVGRTVEHVDVLWARTIDRPAPTIFADLVTGVRFTDVGRRGKVLHFEFDRPYTLLVHLRMSGRFALRSRIEGPGDDKHARVRMALDDGTWLVFIDPRKFGRFYLVEDVRSVLHHLGPDAMSPAFNPRWLETALAGRRGEIKRLLLDQRFVAGIGNIYVSESLWRAGIHPARAAGSLSAEECRRLYAAIVAVLGESIAAGGTSLEDRQYVYPNGELGGYRLHLSVYDRAAEACPRCGYAIERLVQGQRSSYYCPICQPLSGSEREEDNVETQTLKINGMSCQMCVKHVTRALEGVAGVTEVKVNLEPGTAVVTFDPATAGLPAFESAVAEAGYEVAGQA